jgi:hypothetical protein
VSIGFYHYDLGGKFDTKRLKGFEPSTFCMAITPRRGPRLAEVAYLQRLPERAQTAPPRKCAAM